MIPTMLLLFSPLPLGGEGSGVRGSDLPRALLVLADKMFQQGNHAGAADIYDRFVESGSQDGRLFLNQGNAHFLAGNLGQAILAYRRAERWIPNDARLRANLADARGRVLDSPAPSGSFWPEVRLSRPLALIFYAAGWLGIVLWVWGRDRRPIVAAIVLWAAAGLLCGSVARLEYADAVRPVAVVAADGVILRKGNGEAYPPKEVNKIAVRLNRGVEARVLSQRSNGWLQIELADGLVGWAPRQQLLLDREPK